MMIREDHRTSIIRQSHRNKGRAYIAFLSLLCLVFFLGCKTTGSGNKGWKPVSPKKKVFIHEVSWQDETYEIVAGWYTGSKKNADILIDSNPALDPDGLQPGDKIYIPGRLLRTRKIMPRSYVDKSLAGPVKKKRKQTVKKKAPEKVKKTDQKSFELFGPR